MRFHHPPVPLICYNSPGSSAAHSKFHWCGCSDKARSACLQRVSADLRRHDVANRRIRSGWEGDGNRALESTEAITAEAPLLAQAAGA